MGNFILYQIFNLMDRTNSIAGIIYMFKTIDFIYKKHENNLFPIGNKFLMLPLNLVQYLGPSVHKTGPIDSILYTMIVSGLLHPFLAILDFFRFVSRPSHPLQVGKSWKFGIFGNFCVKNGRNCTFWGVIFWVKKSL